MTSYAYAALPTLVVRTPKVAVFYVGTRALGQVRSINPTMTYDYQEQEYARVGDDSVAKVTTNIRDDHQLTIDLYEKGLDQKELRLMLGKAETGALSDVTLSKNIAPFDCSIAIYASNTVGAEPEVIYDIADFQPRTWALTNDAESKDLLHRITGIHAGVAFDNAA